MFNLEEFTPVQVAVLGREYTYKMSNLWLDTIDAGDYVMVDFGSKGFVIGEVRSIGKVPLDANAKFKYKWIAGSISKGDLALYNQILDAEARTRAA